MTTPLPPPGSDDDAVDEMVETSSSHLDCFRFLDRLELRSEHERERQEERMIMRSFVCRVDEFRFLSFCPVFSPFLKRL